MLVKQWPPKSGLNHGVLSRQKCGEKIDKAGLFVVFHLGFVHHSSWRGHLVGLFAKADRGADTRHPGADSIGGFIGYNQVFHDLLCA